jgi:uncharacterized protein YndB with AHSA1/START domain
MGFAFLLVLLIIIPVILPSKFSLSRKIEITAPIASIFSNLTDLNEYEKWNPFPEGDPTNQTTVTGLGLSSYLVWKGNKTGEGKMTITGLDPNQKISVKMEFYKPMPGEGMVYWILKAKSESLTEMDWKFEQDLSYFKRYFGLMMESLMGKHFEKGLVNFKNLIETSKKIG